VTAVWPRFPSCGFSGQSYQIMRLLVLTFIVQKCEASLIDSLAGIPLIHTNQRYQKEVLEWNVVQRGQYRSLCGLYRTPVSQSLRVCLVFHKQAGAAPQSDRVGCVLLTRTWVHACIVCALCPACRGRCSAALCCVSLVFY
jgi:hypothetical protein